MPSGIFHVRVPVDVNCLTISPTAVAAVTIDDGVPLSLDAMAVTRKSYWSAEPSPVTDSLVDVLVVGFQVNQLSVPVSRYSTL